VPPVRAIDSFARVRETGALGAAAALDPGFWRSSTRSPNRSHVPVVDPAAETLAAALDAFHSRVIDHGAPGGRAAGRFTLCHAKAAPRYSAARPMIDGPLAPLW
jgi:hypothetical protein